MSYQPVCEQARPNHLNPRLRLFHRFSYSPFVPLVRVFRVVRGYPPFFLPFQFLLFRGPSTRHAHQRSPSSIVFPKLPFSCSCISCCSWFSHPRLSPFQFPLFRSPSKSPIDSLLLWFFLCSLCSFRSCVSRCSWFSHPRLSPFQLPVRGPSTPSPSAFSSQNAIVGLPTKK